MKPEMMGFIVLVVFLIVTASGCVTGDTPQNSTPEKKYDVLVCPNPDCSYNNPDAHTGYGSGQRSIDMEIDENNQKWYLCQYCGYEWSA